MKIKKILIKIQNYKSKHKKIIRLFLIILFMYLLLVAGSKTIQVIATFPAIFVNVQNIVGHIETDLQYEEINISDGKGNNINGLYVDGGTGSNVVYYFHGNGGPLSYFYNEIKYINNLGYSVIAYDYPGYGKSTGFPYKENVDNFSDIFYKKLKKDKNINDSELVIWGYSIGTAVATDFASKKTFDKLILVSPFSSRYDMVKKIFGFNLAKYLLLDNSYNTKELVRNITRPVLIIHGNNDKIVPFYQGKEVFENYEGDKNFIELDNFGHNYIILTYGKSLKNILTQFLEGNNLGFKNKYLLLNDKEKFILEKKQDKVNLINSFDLETDSSITKFVNSKVSFNDKSYIPKNLEKVGSDYVFDNKGGRQVLRKETNIALQKLAESFFYKFNKKLSVVSAYRSYAYQKGIKDRGCPDNLCSKAGFSEHQSGLAVDLFEASSELNWKKSPVLKNYYKWLDENAYKYGFHNTYQKGLEIDGYEIEPWHWRYLGLDLAKYLKENNITIAEFYFNKNK